MPVRQLALLLGLFCLCLAIVGLSWASGMELFLFVPTGHAVSNPPTHPGIILGVLIISSVVTYWLRQAGMYFFIVITLGMILGTIMGLKGFRWNPSFAQYSLTVVMTATSTYAWTQKDCFEE